MLYQFDTTDFCIYLSYNNGIIVYLQCTYTKRLKNISTSEFSVQLCFFFILILPHSQMLFESIEHLKQICFVKEKNQNIKLIRIRTGQNIKEKLKISLK